MDDLRSWWEVPSIAHFCSLFRSAFDLTDFDIEDLEEGFLQSETEDGSAFLTDLLCHLLNGCYGRKDITITNYDLYVKDIIKYKWDTTENPVKEKSEFKTLSLREKVELIYAICEYRLDTEDVIEQLKGFEGDSMRVEPLGKDKNGALYWYFYGNKLYMEDPEPKKELTKEEKRAKERQRRIEANRKKQEEKRQKKEEKRKLKALRKVERQKKLEEAAKNQKKLEESNTRRSGRIRTRKIEIPESSSSDSSSSSEEEEEIEESSEEEEEKEEKVEQKSGKGRSRKTPVKTSAKKEAAGQKTGSAKKETPAKIQNPCDASHRKDSAAKGKNFLRLLQDQEVLVWLHFLMDVVSCLSKVSESIQYNNATLADVWNELQSAKIILTKYVDSAGPHLRKINCSGVVEVSRRKLLLGIVDALDKRFEGDLHLFKGSSFLSFKNWPETIDGEIGDYGDSDVANLVRVCHSALQSADCETDMVENDWIRFKTDIYNCKKTLVQSLSWEAIWTSMSEKYSNLFTLVSLLLSLPSSSVDAERGFSRMKIQKSDWRSRLGDRNLSDLMLVSMEGPEVGEFNPDAAIQQWESDSIRSRRPYFNDTDKPKGSRSSNRRSRAAEKTPQMDTNTRRSSRLRKKPEPPPLPSPYNSETEEEIDYDYDSGHESGGSLRSETSKASTSKKSLQSVRVSSRRPTVNIDLKRDLSQTEDDGEEDEDGNSNTADDRKGDTKVDLDNEGTEVQKDSAKDECKGDDKVNSDDEGKGDNNGNHDNEMTVKTEMRTEDGSGEGKVVDKSDIAKSEEAEESIEVEEVNTKSEITDCVEVKQEESKDNQVNESSTKSEELQNVSETCESQDSEKHLDEVSKNQEKESLPDETENKKNEDDITEQGVSKNIEDDTIEQGVSVKTENDENAELELEKMEVDNEEPVNEECSGDKEDSKSENINMKNEEQDNKPKIDDEDLSNDTTDANSKRVLRKRNTEEFKSESKNSEHGDSKESESKEQSKPRVFTLSEPAVAPQPSTSPTRWHLVCDSLDDWINLAEWFKDSEVRCEKALSKVIREDFLPVLPEIIDAREKEKMKKLLQEQELRRSNRITIKMREKMEQEKILAEALAEEEKARIRSEEEKRLKEEQLRLEDENRQREERLKAREERSKRQYMREERSRLLAEGKEIPPEMIYTATHKYKDDGEDSDDSKCDLKEEEDFEALMKVINAMKYHKDCWPFLEPVTDEQAPGYSDVIKRPMDMSKIEEKVEHREYRSTQHFLSDFRLMFNNCKRFNGQDSEFSDCARSMENMLKKYMKRFVSDEPTDKYYEDKPFVIPGVRGARTGEKRYRPQRAASSRALQTVHKALNSDDETESEDEEDRVPVRKKPKDGQSDVFKTQSHHNLLLQEMIELKRQREKKLAASALHNHGVITRGPERIRVPNPQGGIMIIPKSEMNASGVLRMAATREIKRKVTPQPQLPNLAPQNRQGRQLMVHQSGSETVLKADLSKKEPGLSILDQTTPGSTQPKTIRIVASNASGQPSVKQTAESVKVSADGYLIISGKNSGIKVTENTKIVIQPPGANPSSADGSGQPQTMTKEILIKKIPTPASLKQVPGLTLSGMAKTPDNATPGTASATVGSPNQAPFQVSVSASPSCQMPIQQQVSLQRLLKQTASSPQLSQQQAALQGFVNQMGEKGQLTPDMKKKLDIAQRILLLNQQKRKLLEKQKMSNPQQQQQQQQEQQQQQQNGPPPGVHPPKIIKLDLDVGAVNSSAIEERLRDPGVSVDNQLGSVSENVISNVNIASDILDTYYSVLNDAKSKAGMATQQNSASVAAITQPQNTLPLTDSVTISSSVASTTVSQLPTTVQGFVLHEAQNTVTAIPENQKPASVQGNMSEVTRQIYNLINKSGSGGLVSTLAKAQLVKQNSPTVVKEVKSEQSGSPLVQISTVPSHSVSAANLVSQTGLNIPLTKPVTTLSSNSSISDLLRSAMVKPETKTSEVSPIEALFANNTPVKIESDSVSKPGTQSTLLQALTSKPSVTLNTTPQKVSPDKSERQNLFDTFDSNTVQPVVAGEQFIPGQSERFDVSKEIKLKLRADGVSLPSSSTLNFGSPLKTSSVLEALKCKLHTVKPYTQGNENQSSVGNVESLCICSELASCSSPASNDLYCELHPCCMCINTSNDNPACSSSVEIFNSGDGCPNTDVHVYSPKCSLASPCSVQSENILQNSSVDETKMSQIPDNCSGAEEIYTAILLEKFLQIGYSGGTEFYENEKEFVSATNQTRNAMVKESGIEATKPKSSCCSEDITEDIKDIENISEIRFENVIETNDENDFEKVDDDKDELVKEATVSENITELNAVKVGVMGNFKNSREGVCERDTEAIMMEKDSENKELTQSKFESTDDGLNCTNSYRTRTFSGYNYDENERNCLKKNEAIEFIVKKVPTGHAYLDENENTLFLNTKQTKECYALVPIPFSPVCVTIESGQDSLSSNQNHLNGYPGNMTEERKSSEKPKAKKRGCKGNYKYSQKNTQEMKVVFRPWQITRHPYDNYSPFLDENIHSKKFQSVVNSPTKNFVSKGLNSVLLKDSLCKIGGKKITEVESVEIRKDNKRVKRKHLTLSSEPVKTYKLSGLKPNVSAKNMKDITPCGKSLCSKVMFVDNMNSQCKIMEENRRSINNSGALEVDSSVHSKQIADCQHPLNISGEIALTGPSQTSLLQRMEIGVNKETVKRDIPSTLSEPVKMYKLSGRKSSVSAENKNWTFPTINMTPVIKPFFSDGIDIAKSRCKMKNEQGTDFSEYDTFLTKNTKQDSLLTACQELKNPVTKSDMQFLPVTKDSLLYAPLKRPSCPTSVKETTEVKSVETGPGNASVQECTPRLSSDPVKVQELLGHVAEPSENENKNKRLETIDKTAVECVEKCLSNENVQDINERVSTELAELNTVSGLKKKSSADIWNQKEGATFNETFCFTWKDVDNMPSQCMSLLNNKEQANDTNPIETEISEIQQNLPTVFPIFTNTSGNDGSFEPTRNDLLESVIRTESAKEENTYCEKEAFKKVTEVLNVESGLGNENVLRNRSKLPCEPLKLYKISEVRPDSSAEDFNQASKPIEAVAVYEASKDKFVYRFRKDMSKKRNALLTACQSSAEEKSFGPPEIPTVESYIGIKSANGRDLHSLLLKGPSFKTKINKVTVVESFEEGVNKDDKVKRVRLSSEPVRMYKISGIKSNSFVENLCHGSQTIDITPASGECCSDLKNAEKTPSAYKKRRKNVLIKNRQTFSKEDTSVTKNKKQDILLAACQALKNVTSEDDFLEPPESPFFESDIGIESEIPLSDFDINQIFNEDFFSTELYSPINPSNLFYGDGPSVDTELEKIETDVFELQDRYEASASTIASLLPGDQSSLPATSVTLQYSAVNSNLSTNSLDTSQGVVDISSNSNIQATHPVVVPHVVSVANVNTLPLGPSSQTSMNVPAVHYSVPLGVSPEFTKGNVSVQQASTGQLPTTLIQGGQIQGLLPLVLQKESVNISQATAVQTSLPQNQVQIPPVLLQALQQVAGGMTVNPTSQNALLQQLNALVTSRQSNLQLGVQNTNVVNSIQQINQSNTVMPVNQQVYTQSHSHMKSEPTYILQSSLQSVPVQNVLQLSEETFSDVASTQNNTVGQTGMELGSGNQSIDISGIYSAENVGVTNTYMNSDAVTFRNNLGQAGGIDTSFNTAVSSNLSTVNQMSAVIGGDNAQFSDQSSFSVTSTDMMDTSQNANISLNEATENQSVQNQ